MLRPIHDIKAVLFDIYGTLFISGVGEIGTTGTEGTAAEGSVFFDALDEVGIKNYPAADVGDVMLQEAIRSVHAEMQREGIQFPEVDIVEIWRSTLKRLQREGYVDSRTFSDEVLQQVATAYEVRRNPAWPMPGAQECARDLNSAGILLGLVSNAQFFTPELFPALLNKDLDELGFDEHLRFYSYKTRRAKPGTELYVNALEQLKRRGITPAETLFVGNDMLNDITAAGQAGFRTALFAGDSRSLRLREGDPRVDAVVPDLVIDHLEQLPTCLLSND